MVWYCPVGASANGTVVQVPVQGRTYPMPRTEIACRLGSQTGLMVLSGWAFVARQERILRYLVRSRSQWRHGSCASPFLICDLLVLAIQERPTRQEERADERVLAVRRPRNLNDDILQEKKAGCNFATAWGVSAHVRAGLCARPLRVNTSESKGASVLGPGREVGKQAFQPATGRWLLGGNHPTLNSCTRGIHRRPNQPGSFMGKVRSPPGISRSPTTST